MLAKEDTDRLELKISQIQHQLSEANRELEDAIADRNLWYNEVRAIRKSTQLQVDSLQVEADKAAAISKKDQDSRNDIVAQLQDTIAELKHDIYNIEVAKTELEETLHLEAAILEENTAMLREDYASFRCAARSAQDTSTEEIDLLRSQVSRLQGELLAIQALAQAPHTTP
jgi:hypothetical protein